MHAKAGIFPRGARRTGGQRFAGVGFLIEAGQLLGYAGSRARCAGSWGRAALVQQGREVKRRAVMSGRSPDGVRGRKTEPLVDRGQSVTIVPATAGPVAYSVCHHHDHARRRWRRGVFAPGHLGDLTQFLPFELVDDILAQTKRAQRRLRDLPPSTSARMPDAFAAIGRSAGPP